MCHLKEWAWPSAPWLNLWIQWKEAVTSYLFPASLAGDHAVEERGRGEKEHVPSGRHRLAEVRGLSRLRERSGASSQGGERLEAPHVRASAVEPATSGPSSCFYRLGWRKGGCRAVTVSELGQCAWGSSSSFRPLVYFLLLCLSSFSLKSDYSPASLSASLLWVFFCLYVYFPLLSWFDF